MNRGLTVGLAELVEPDDRRLDVELLMKRLAEHPDDDGERKERDEEANRPLLARRGPREEEWVDAVDAEGAQEHEGQVLGQALTPKGV